MHMLGGTWKRTSSSFAPRVSSLNRRCRASTRRLNAARHPQLSKYLSGAGAAAHAVTSVLTGMRSAHGGARV